MFAIPGICALIVFILARPQEFLPLFQKLPFLYIFCFMAIGGFVLDLKLRRLEPVAAPTLPWVAGFLLWGIICDAVRVPANLTQSVISLGIIFTLYATIAHGVQRFRTLHVVAGTVMVTCLYLSAVCFHQGLQPRSCVAADEMHPGEGKPDGRSCEMALDCQGPDAEPGSEYRCEKVGLFGTYSIEDRVRYRGELHDPNELSMTICVGGLAFLIAFAMQKRSGPWTVGAFVGGVLIVWTVIMSQSRGGLVVALVVLGASFIKRYGWSGLVAAGLAGLPLMMLGGRSGESADQSTFLRYEAWGAGLGMFKGSPIFGVGTRQFAEHFFMTAHNSYVLTLAETGMIGFYLFVAMLALSAKILWRGVVDLEHVPGARVARIWGLALLSSFFGLLFQIHTLSFAYHSVLWIYLGLASAYWSAVRVHKPDFQVRLTPRDLALIGVGCVSYAFVVLPVFLKLKGAM